MPGEQIRAFGPQSLSGTAKPVFGTTLTAATPVPAPDPRQNNIYPGVQVPPVAIAVASSAFFKQGDQIYVGPAAGPFETAAVMSVPSGGLTLSVSAGQGNGLTKSHPSTDLVILNIECSHVMVQADSANSAVLYLGVASSVTSTDPSLIYEIAIPGANGELPKYSETSQLQNNTIKSGQYWINGASGKFVASIFQV